MLEQGQVNVWRHRRNDYTFTRRRKDARWYAPPPAAARNRRSYICLIFVANLGIVPKLLSALRSAGIITEDLSLSSDARDNLECTYRGLCVRSTKAGQDARIRIRRRIGASNRLLWMDACGVSPDP
jgi:hypothetical protein